MLKNLSLILFCFLTLNAHALNYEILSQDFLYKVRVEEDVQEIKQKLQNVSAENLAQSLTTEHKQKTIWLNIYNAYIQLKAKAHPEMISEARNDFFSKKWICIADENLSFDNIEHGMLRASQWKYGMGYIKAWFPSKFEKTFRVNQVDYRIHFALNCGAAGCPPIAFYESQYLKEQLNIATQGFIELNTIYDDEKNTVEVSKILSWFKGDFGGNDGIRDLLDRLHLIPENKKVKILYKEYDWTLSLKNYVE